MRLRILKRSVNSCSSKKDLQTQGGAKQDIEIISRKIKEEVNELINKKLRHISKIYDEPFVDYLLDISRESLKMVRMR